MQPFSLYIHIPFCARKCAYCDFASYPGQEGRWEEYLAALNAELQKWAERLHGREIATIFIGGGTPSLLPAEAIETLMNDVRRLFAVAADAEISMEANPGTLTAEKLAVYKKTGINRLSLGVQSFDDGLLRALGRIHTAEDAREAVRLAREAGFENINLDLMYALPGQTTAQWKATLETSIALGVEHISAYSLIVEDGTPMAARVESGEAILPEDEAVIDMQHMAIDTLAAAGYARYEISNYAKSGRECRHNLVYWLRGDYLGVGCAAHSMLDNVRFENAWALEEYLAGETELDRHKLPVEEQKEEMIMLATRTVRGLSLAEYKKSFGEDFESAHAAALKPLIGGGLVKIENGYLRLTRAGMEVQNAVVVELLD